MRLALPQLDPYLLAKRAIGRPLWICFPARVDGLDNVPATGPVVLAPNHMSIMDSIVLANVVPRRITFVAKAEHFADWRSGWALKLTGQICLERGRATAIGRALGSAGAVLSSGGAVGIYPEGTRSRDGMLHRGNDGPAWLATIHEAPIVPVGLVGTADVHAPGEMLPHPFREVRVRFGSPIVAKDRAASRGRRARAALTEEVMAAIAGLSGQERVGEAQPAATV
jgi:1-acyl-sn-glycerol-3-phosphate acyltransferase